MSQFRIWIRGAVLVAILAASAVAFGCGGPLRMVVLAPVSALVLHTPDARDEFFNLVAVDFEQPGLCERISWRADDSSGGWDSPYRLRTLRSTCRSRMGLPRNQRASVAPFWMAEFADQVRALGYSGADLMQAAHVHGFPGTPAYTFYQDLLANNEFRSRLRAAPAQAEPRDRALLRPARPIEYMFQMVAVDAPEAALCSRISPNATFATWSGETALLQSGCYLHVAENARDVRLCDPLPAAGSFPHIHEHYDSRESCRQTVAIYSRPDFKGTVNAGAMPFTHAADLTAILLEIGYPPETLPRVPEPTDDDYWQFVSRMIDGDPTSERAEFLRRVAALE